MNEAIRPALLVIAKDSEDKTQAVQAIFLDEKTANKAEVKIKNKLGVFQVAQVSL